MNHLISLTLYTKYAELKTSGLRDQDTHIALSIKSGEIELAIPVPVYFEVKA